MNILCKMYVCIKKKILINTHLHMFLYKYVFISAHISSLFSPGQYLTPLVLVMHKTYFHITIVYAVDK